MLYKYYKYTEYSTRKGHRVALTRASLTTQRDCNFPLFSCLLSSLSCRSPTFSRKSNITDGLLVCILVCIDTALLLGGEWSYVDPIQSDPSTRISSPDLEKGEWVDEKSEAIKAARREELKQNRKSAVVFVRLFFDFNASLPISYFCMGHL